MFKRICFVIQIQKNNSAQADLLIAQIQKSNTNTQFKFSKMKGKKNYVKEIHINT